MKPSLLLLVFLVVQAPAAQPRHDGVASWPNLADDGEGGCYSQWRTTARVLAYAEPRTTSRHTRTVEANRRIDLNDRTESLRVLRSHGQVRTRRALSLQVIGPGARPSEYRQTTLSLPASAVLETMWYGGSEGSDFVYDGTSYRGDVPAEQWLWDEYPAYRRDFEVDRYPTVENWVRLAPQDGKPAAWLDVSQGEIIPTEAACEEY